MKKPRLKKFFLSVLLSGILSSCQYPPFLKYYFPSKKTHVARFSKWERYMGSNSNPLRTCFDVTEYDWAVHVNPDKKKITATMKIHFRMEADQDSILLDFQRHMSMDSVKSSVPLKKTRRKKDALFLVFGRNIKKGESVVVEITYHGTPVKMLSYSSITWGKDENKKPWICTATEGIGPHHMMPCKNLLSDEPDSCFIQVGVPKDLVGVSNGKLEGVTETASEKIYKWAVRNPINIYSMVFNVGDYVRLEKDYLDIDHVLHPIEIYVLSRNKSQADTFYNQAPVIMQKLEQLYGPYPWWRDGCKFVETCLPKNFSMEHQSALSISGPYRQHYQHINFTLVHELAHEWWGNNTTAFDYADLWLHEGFADYSEALFAERHFAAYYYDWFMQYFRRSVKNKRPVMKPYDVRYNNLVHGNDEDIYPKGALFLHTLRMQLNNDSLFFQALKAAQLKFAKSSFNTNQFMAFFNEQTNRDFTPYFDVYLRRTKPPILEFKFSRPGGDTTLLEYKWKEKLPENFDMKVYLLADDKKQIIYPRNDLQRIKFYSAKSQGFDRVLGYILFEEKR